jgi:hypothetical protein
VSSDKWANPQKMWDERFSQHEPVYGEAPNAFLAAQSARFQPGMKLLVPADGYGLATWNWPVNHFDGVFAIFLHLPPADRAKVHASMVRAAKPSGLIILEAFSPAQLRHISGGPKRVELLYTAETLRQDFFPAEPLLLEEIETHITEGPMHSGPAAVVRAIFRK